MMKSRSSQYLALGLGLGLALGVLGPAKADPAAACQAQGGSYLSGTILHGPFFVRARHYRHGVALSHTKIILRGDNGQIYDIRADNVFANGYDSSPRRVPAPLSSLHVGERLYLCGKLYQSRSGRLGMDWVHTNCGAAPSHSAPNGSLALTPGQNLENSREYCGLW